MSIQENYSNSSGLMKASGLGSVVLASILMCTVTLTNISAAQAGNRGLAGLGAGIAIGAMLNAASQPRARYRPQRKRRSKQYRKSTRRHRNRSKKRTTTSYSKQRAEMKRIQESLNFLGFNVGNPDGSAGRNTKKGIRNFQTSLNQPATGKLTGIEKQHLFDKVKKILAGQSQPIQQKQFSQNQNSAVGNGRVVNMTQPLTINAPVAVINAGKVSHPKVDPTSYKKTGMDRIDTIAVLIGNKNYKNGLDQVSFGQRDATAMRYLLTRRLGVDTDNIIDLRDATLSELNQVFGKENTQGNLARMVRDVSPGGNADIFVFYSGHGMPDYKNGESYLLPVDGNPSDPETSAFSLNLMYKKLTELNVSSVSVFIDACFSGGSGTGGAMIKGASPGRIVPTTKAPSAVMAQNDSSVKASAGARSFNVFTASSGRQLARWDMETGHGLFTKYVLKGLVGPADLNNDNKITNGELKRYVSTKVKKHANKVYKSDQEPYFKGDENKVLAVGVY